MESRILIKSTLQVTILSLSGIVFGFLSQLLIAYFFGTGNQRDAYFGAIVIPTYVVAIFIGSIGAVFMSHYINIATNNSKERSIKYFNNLLSSCFLILTSLMLVIMLFAERIIQITVPGFTAEQLAIAANMLRILAPTVLFQSLTNIFGSVIQSGHRFILPAIPAVVTSLVTILFVSFFGRVFGIFSLAWGNLFGNGLAFLIISFSLIRTKEIQLSFNIDILDDDVKKTFKAAAPLLIAGVVYRFSSVWERMLASKLTIGSISFLGYANQLLIVLSTLTSGGISTIFFPVLSRAWSNKDMATLKENFTKAVVLLLYISLPVAFLFCYMRVEFVQVLFERGAFNRDSTIAVGGTLALLMGAFIFQSLGSIVTRSFYYMEMTIAASLIGIIEIAIYLLVSIILVKYFSFYGLAFSFSFAAMSNVIISALIVNKKIKFLTQSLWMDLLKILFSCIVSTTILWLARLTYLNVIAATISSSLLFALIYVFLTYFLKIAPVMNAKVEIFRYIRKQ